MERFHDRYQAGQLLSQKLKHYANRNDVFVLALPRGGVPVAAMIAKELHASLDLMIVRKLGVPGHEELAFGALANNGVKVYNKDLLKQLFWLTKEQIDSVIAKEEKELIRRNNKYRGGNLFPVIQDKVVILVDDGIATGASMRAAVMALRQENPKKIIIAVPVAPHDTSLSLTKLVDEYICLHTPIDFSAVGLWYDDFSQTEDDEVIFHLKGFQEGGPLNR